MMTTSLSAFPNQIPPKPIYFGVSKEKPKPPPKQITPKQTEVDLTTLKETLLTYPLSLTHLAAFTYAGLNGFLALGMQGLVPLIVSLIVAAVFAGKMDQKNVAKIVTDFEEREAKANEFRAEWTEVTPRSLEKFLSRQSEYYDLTLVYLTQSRNNVAEALMHDAKAKALEEANADKEMRVLHYDLNQRGAPKSFELPPVDLGPKKYPCFALVNSKGEVLNKHMGVGKMKLETITEIIKDGLLLSDIKEEA